MFTNTTFSAAAGAVALNAQEGEIPPVAKPLNHACATLARSGAPHAVALMYGAPYGTIPADTLTAYARLRD